MFDIGEEAFDNVKNVQEFLDQEMEECLEKHKFIEVRAIVVETTAELI